MSNPDDKIFNDLATEMLERVAEAVDDSLGDEIDVELQGGILTMSLPGGGQYVLNKHAPKRELWLSSPVSGAWHFTAVGNGWLSTREPQTSLVPLLTRELSDRFNTEVQI